MHRTTSKRCHELDPEMLKLHDNRYREANNKICGPWLVRIKRGMPITPYYCKVGWRSNSFCRRLYGVRASVRLPSLDNNVRFQEMYGVILHVDSSNQDGAL